MNIEVLVPTMNKTKDDIVNLYRFLNIQSDALFTNQCGKNEKYSLDIDGHVLRVICNDTIGVSINRNILLDNCAGDICICIDDDCSLIDEYNDLISKTFQDKKCNLIYFNGEYIKHNNRKVIDKKSRMIKKYFHISRAGAPGLVFKKEIIKKYNLSFRTDVGVPNEICAGEDSLFYYDLVKTKEPFYRCSQVIFKITNDDLDSTYYKGINKQYVKSRCYISRIIHPTTYFLYLPRHIMRFYLADRNNSLKDIISWCLEGAKSAKN